MWKDNKKNGKGKEVYKNGESFVGQFKDDSKEGEGLWTFKGNFKFEGTWKNNKKNGVGKFYFPDGSFEDREYLNNVEVNLATTNQGQK